MDQTALVFEYKCPCCNAGLIFGEQTQKMTCAHCDNTFDLETVRAYYESQLQPDHETFFWEETQREAWEEAESGQIQMFQCPSCGGEILAEETTAATFCPYCDNPTVLPSRLTGVLRPDAVIPFQNSKEDAKAAFLQLCKGKVLLPKDFTHTNRLEKISGVYIPFWLYDCGVSYQGSYKATRVHHWSDSNYHYTRTEHYLLHRDANADFCGIPMDGSEKMDDVFMESIEPYDYSQLMDFDMAYLSGFLADKYDVPAENGEERIRQRVQQTIHEELQSTMIGYTTVHPASKQLDIMHSKARYVLLPVWMLNTKYRGKVYTFAMNGQTGKMTGELPVCPKRTGLWFAGISAAATLLAHVCQLLF